MTETGDPAMRHTPVLATKLFVPARRASLVARPRLLERLDTTLAAGNRLTLVSAPAGFGKTTLITDWLTDLEARPAETHVGWLSLDEDDNNLSRLLAHLTAALSRAGIDVGPGPAEAHHGSPVPVLTGIVNEVTRAAERSPGTHWVLVCDDFHVITEPAAHEFFSSLVSHVHPDLHLVVATRADPPLPLARLRGRGELTEVRAADLRCTAGEATEFLNRVMGLSLTDTDVAALEERTEGWIVGLQLAALSLRGTHERHAVDDFLKAFTGSNRFVIDYLVDEVLARQPVEIRSFLLRTSILDRLTASLCNAVVGRDDGSSMLERLERDNLFAVPLDDQRVWYRYHHLFADVLSARLLAEHPEELPVLHRRASDWFAAHELPIRAVRHAVAAEDFDRAARLMEGALAAMRRARQDSLLVTWVQSLPDAVVRASPVLSVVAAWSQLMGGHLDAVENHLEAAGQALAAGAENPDLPGEWAQTEDLRTAPAMIAIYRAALAQARGDVPDIVRHARQALDLVGPGDHHVRAAGLGYLGLAGWAEGNVADALITFESAVRSLHSGGSLVDELDSVIVRADMLVGLGRPGQARKLYERTLERATGAGEPFPRVTADLHVGLAELDLELDDLVRAEEHLEAARVLGQVASITENRHRWFVASAGVRAARGDYLAAADLLDEAESLYRPGFYPEIRPISAVRARLRIAAGDVDSAREWAQERGLGIDDAPVYLREFDHLTLVRLLLAEHRAGHRDGDAGDAAPADAALRLLDRLHAAASRAGRAGSLMEIGSLQALAYGALGNRSQALATLESTWLEAPEPAGYVRLYLDGGEPMRDLLQHAAEHGPRLPEHLRRCLGGGTPTAPGPALVDPLSMRETEVLRLLDTPLTGPEIAGQLYVSLNTLRTHTKRIFTKLEVNNRATAVRRAHELGLL